MRLIQEILKACWLPTILCAVVILLILKLTNISDQNVFNIVFGVALGVALGFIADLTKRSIDDLQNKLNARKILYKLLEQDARNIYKTMWLYESLLNAQDVPEEMKVEVRKQIPPSLELRYWYRLTQNQFFLMFASEKPFDKIFDQMWNFEKINEQIARAQSQDSNDVQKRQAYIFAHAFYQHAIQDREHKILLLNFLSEKDIIQMEDKWRAIANKKAGKDGMAS